MDRTINSDVYRDKLEELNAAIYLKRPAPANRKSIVIHRNYVRLYTSLQMRQKLLGFDWKVLLHHPYSPDLAPYEFYLFHPIQNSMNGQAFNAEENKKIRQEEFCAVKDRKFF